MSDQYEQIESSRELVFDRLEHLLELAKKAVTKGNFKSVKNQLVSTHERHESYVKRLSEHEDHDDDRIHAAVQEFTTQYCVIYGLIEDGIDALDAKQAAEHTTEAKKSPKVKFPTITLPEFDGSLEKWLTFRDTYESMIHNNEALTKIEKFHYLMTAMKLPAGHQNVIANFTLCDDQYELAWTTIRERYDNTQRLKSHQLNNLLGIKKMTNESASEIRRILDSYSTTMSTLSKLKVTWDEFVVFLVRSRLDEQTVKDWERHLGTQEPTWELLRKFLTAQWRILEQIQPTQLKAKQAEAKPLSTASKGKAFTTSGGNAIKCSLCKLEHKLSTCPKFAALTSKERCKFVADACICRNCFSPQHNHLQCTSKFRCRRCKGDHHTMTHIERSTASTSQNQQRFDGNASSRPSSDATAPHPTAPPAAEVSHSNNSDNFTPFSQMNQQRFNPGSSRSNLSLTNQSFAFNSNSHESFLSTTSLQLIDVRGSFSEARALLDSGSQSNYVTSETAHRLGLKLVKVNHQVIGINGKVTQINHVTQITFSSKYGPYQREIWCLVMPDITGNLPAQDVNIDKLSIPESCELADPEFNKSKNCDMLLGNTIYLDSVLAGKIRLADGPILQEFKFGWAVGGDFSYATPTSSTMISSFSFHLNTDEREEIDEKLERFMELEQFDSTTKRYSPEEKFCAELYDKTTHRDATGRYVVQLPCKSQIDKLSSNFGSAYRQFLAHEKSMQKDEETCEKYHAYMQEYIASGDMTALTHPDSHDGYYLPHHVVKKESSTTTKVRPVFNGSSKTSNGLSLNDCLCVGPNVQPDLTDHLIRFREQPYVLKGDVEKMYRQVYVDPSQRKYMKILYRHNMQQPIRHFALNTVTFGLASSSYLATQTLNRIADDNQQNFSAAADRIRNSFNVDDYLAGFKTIEEGIKIRDQTRYMLLRAHFPLRKFSSNDKRLLKGLSDKDIEPVDDDNAIVKTLGLNWFPRKDKLSLNFKAHVDGPVTKASVLSQIASIYDPLGIVGPVVLKAKLFMKILWSLKMQWKDELPSEESQQWLEFQTQIPALNEVFVDRHVVIKNPVTVELHGFCDASMDAYGAACYVRATDLVGHVQVSLICAKSRVSPPKQKTIARLELCSGVLVSKISAHVVEISALDFIAVFLWSDSMIALYWILTQAHKLSVFVGNRVAVIQELTAKFTWKHVSSANNPADVISRGLMPEEIKDCKLWWQGPEFLQLPATEWPESLITINEQEVQCQQEFRKSFVASQPNSIFVYIESRSRYNILINTFARIIRALRNRSFINDLQDSPTVDERERARVCIIRIVQQNIFQQEYRHLAKAADEPSVNEIFPRSSSLISLTPYMDKDERIIRVGGRLEACASLTHNQKHQIILPKSNLAKSIIRHLHKKLMHPGDLAMLAAVRENYWPIGAKAIIKQVKSQCLICFRASPKLASQIMGSLPAARVTMSPPFTRTAVDFTGYFNIRSSLTYKHSIIKVYVALFKCMSTGAIHLEAVTELSTQAFIAALDRFISRRGLCTDMFSDNGTNFVGADIDLKKIRDEIEPRIAEYLASNSIKWHFTVPNAPHAGGYYESGIKTMKHHLLRVTADRSFDFEQFSTVLAKVEAIINSRPITPVSDDPNDLQYLSPAHFLIGRSLIAKPERNFLHCAETRLDRWNKLQQIQQQFWEAWYHDYLHHLQQRPINFREKHEFQVGDMVLLKDNHVPPLKWLVGRIIQMFPDKRKVVRNVRVQISKEGKLYQLERHVKYLCLLPLEK